MRQNQGVTERDVPSRHQWVSWALPLVFGEELELSDPWLGLLKAVEGFAAQAIDIREQSLHDAAEVDRVDNETLLAMRESWPTLDASQAADAPMRIVLMGRTMAGKSSLLSALSGSHFERIGDGRQRFSRDVFAATATGSARIEVIDTPGVGAADGAEDVEVAFRAAKDADLILWVASSDSIQRDTADALRLLGVIGKPIIVALNCKQSLAGVGRMKLLRTPERVFGNREGLVDEIRHHMAAAAVQPLDIIYVHALAATAAMTRGEMDTELHTASRIDELAQALIREQATQSESRRALRLIDGQRQQVGELLRLLALGATTLHARAEHGRRMSEDVQARVTRVLRSAGEEMTADIEAGVGRRRDWHLAVTDFGRSLQSAWNEEISALQGELSRTLDDRFFQLTADVESTAADAEAEWATVSSDQFALRDLQGFELVWGNRLARAGLGIGGSLAGGLVGLKLGAAIGGAIGLAAGPLAAFTSVLGGMFGAGVGFALPHLKGLIDRVVLGEAGVMQKRRQEVAEKVGPILDEFTQEYKRAISEQLDKLRDNLASERAQGNQRSARLDRLANRWEQHTEALGGLIRELDKETTASLLRIAGRERLAQSLARATRVPGVCILAEFEDTAFWEAWLYPPHIGERLAGGKVSAPGGEPGSALSYALGLADAPAHLLKANSASATIVVDADLPTEIVEAWSDALTSHLDRHIRIQSTRRARKS